MRITDFDDAPPAAPTVETRRQPALRPERVTVCHTCEHWNDDDLTRPCELLVPIARTRKHCCPANLWAKLAEGVEAHPDARCPWPPEPAAEAAAEPPAEA